MIYIQKQIKNHTFVIIPLITYDPRIMHFQMSAFFFCRNGRLPWVAPVVANDSHIN